MENQHTLNKQTLIALLTGLLVGLLSMGLFVGAAWAAPGAQGSSTPQPSTAEEKECTDCHPDVYAAWMGSSHAHAFDDEEFVRRWESGGEPGECLVCHTTGYQMTTNTFTVEGVQCEACHGKAVEDHPPEVVPVQADTDYCGSCHTTTLGEWRLTGHASAGVGCMDCHDPHSQKALFDDADEMCLNCHKEDMGAYLEDLHIQKDIGCVDCHALVIPPELLPEDGIVPTGHNFTITPATCVACHTDALHAGFSLPGYEQGAKAANGGTTPSTETQPITSGLETSADELAAGGLTTEQRIQALEATLASARLSSLFQGGIIGLVLGGTTAYFIVRNQRRAGQESESGEDTEVVSASEGDAIDRLLDRMTTYFAGFSERRKTGKTKVGENNDSPSDSGEESNHA
jgi:predicted CXXCH cytochrome family protein